jgi:hypothetical protein
MRRVLPILLTLVIAASARAESPDDGALLYRGAKRTVAAAADHEFTRMLSLILTKGADMGPGDGWFKPGESRYGWQWLAARHKVAPTARITIKEFAGPPELFRRLDRDRDGAITAADFDWSERSPYMQQMRQAVQWVRANGDDGRTLTKAEWDAMFKKAAQGKDHLTAEDVRALLFPPQPPRPPGPPPDMPTKSTLLKGLFNGEIGSPFEGPKLGAEAPDFTLADLDGKPVTLSKFRDKKPVVLVFGSFT